MTRLFLHIILVIMACVPLVLLVTNMVQKYPLDSTLIDISLIDAILLIATLSLPLYLLPRLGVDWRAEPEEH